MTAKGSAKDFLHSPSYVPDAGPREGAFEPKDLDLHYDNILLRRDIESEKTDGGIIKPETARTLKHTGVIIATGPACVTNRIGARVIFAKYSGVELTLDGAAYVILQETNILATIPEGVSSERND